MSSTLRYSLVLAACTALGCGPTTSIDGTDGGTSTSTGTPSTGPSAATLSTPVSESMSSSGALDSSSADSTSADSGSLDPTDTDTGSTSACDSYLQDCPDGQKCSPYADDGTAAWNALGCFPVAASPEQPGESCEVIGGATSGFDTCDVGSFCWYVDTGSNIGSCVALCEGSAEAPTCSNASMTCSIANQGVLSLCLLSCDPGGDDCPEGQACFEVETGSVCAPTGAASPGSPGTSCDDIASCDPGAICVTAAAHGPGCDGQGCCTQECELSDPMCDNPDQVCQEWFEDGMVPPGFEDFGVCMVPI